MEDEPVDHDANLPVYDQLLQAMSSKKGKTHSGVLKKRKMQLFQMARSEAEDRKLELETFTQDNDETLEQENIEEEEEPEDETDNEEETGANSHQKLTKDPFKVHFEQDLSEDVIGNLSKGMMKKEEFQNSLPSTVSSFLYDEELPLTESFVLKQLTSLMDMKVVKKLSERWAASSDGEKDLLTSLQKELLRYINSYQDVMFTQRTFENGEDIRSIYCMHAVNHILKTRSRILKNNEKIAQAQKEGKDVEEYRDHGLTRPKVLIVVPFREACLRIVNQIIKLALNMDEKAQVMQKKRFYDEYKDTTEDRRSKVSYVPDDFKAMFAGNNDDCFRIGITVLRRTVRLYADFYSADIIIASPLGLRTIIGAEGESERDFDFLSSIEVLIMDQVDVFQMQNWEHVPHFLDHLHLQPRSAHDTDFSRVRLWTLNGWSPYYRQTLLFSSLVTPEINHVFNKYCKNFAGKVRIQASSCLGSIQQVVSQIPQVYHKVECDSFVDAADKRFEYFVKKFFLLEGSVDKYCDELLPEFRGKLTNRIGIFVPSYFDFVRLRNYFKKNDVSFFQINEYSARANISKARTLFNEGKRQFLIFTERFYFFYRYRLKGMRHIIYYELPQYPLFYPEILNFLQSGNDAVAKAVGTTCTVMYTKYDKFKMENVVGTPKASKMLRSQKNVHMLIS